MTYFTKSMTLEEVKAAYRTAAMQLRPDRGSNTDAMQQLNIEFEITFALAQRFSHLSPRYTQKDDKPSESAGSYRR